MSPWLSVVIPTIGRESLSRTLASLEAQPESAGLEVLVVADTFGGLTPDLEQARSQVQQAGHRFIEHDGGLHCYGHPQRTIGARAASAPWVWFAQDDNIAARDALASIELALDLQRSPRPVFFRFLSSWRETIWRTRELVLGNIDADCLVLPRGIAQQVDWGLRYEGDFDAACQAATLSGGDVVWVDEIVTIARPTENDLWWR